MSLADQLLRERSSSSKRAVRQPIKERALERQFKAQLAEANGVVTLSEAHVAVLRKMLERLDADPFEGGGSGKIDTQDLESLGLGVNPEFNDKGEEDPDPFGQDSEFMDAGRVLGSEDDALINPSAAVVAPVATPDHDRDIPTEVLQAIQVLHSDDEEVPLEAPLPNTAQQAPAGAPQEKPVPQPPEASAGADGGTASPAALADTIRQEYATESARPVAAPVVERRVTEPEPEPAPVLGEGEDLPWRNIMENYRSSHKAGGHDTNISGHASPGEKAAKKRSFLGAIASLRAGT